MQNNIEGIGKRIKQLRVQNKLTQEDLAKKIMVTDKAVSKWETGAGNPDISQLLNISHLFNVTMEYLLTGVKDLNLSLDDMDDAKRRLYIIKEDNLELFKKYNYLDPKFIFHNYYYVRELNIKDLNRNYWDDIFRYKAYNIFLESFKFIKEAIKNQKNIEYDTSFCYMDIFNKNTKDLISMCIENDNCKVLDVLGFNYTKFESQGINKDYRPFINEKDIDIFFENKDKAPKCFKYITKINYEVNKEIKESYLIDVLIEDAIIYGLDDLAYSLGKECKNKDFSFKRMLIELAFDEGKEDLAIKFSNFNKLKKYGYVLNDEEIKVLRIKYNKTISKEQQLKDIIETKKYIDINLLKKLIVAYPKDSNLKYIEKVLKTKPLTKAEDLYKLYTKKEYAKIYEEYNIYENSKEYELDVRNEMIELWNKAVSENELIIYFRQLIDQYDFDLNINHYKVDYTPIDELINEIKSKGNDYKKLWLNNITIEYNTNVLQNKLNNIDKDITKEFILNELSKRNVELVIIKLYIKLYTKVSKNLNKEGDFDTLFSEYTTKFLAPVEEYNGEDYEYVEQTETIELLNKLISNRNYIIDPTNNVPESLTVDELNKLIEYLF